MRSIRKVGRSAPIKGRFAHVAKGNPYDYKWQQRRIVYLRQNPFCVHCRDLGLIGVAATVVDHIIPHQGNQQLFWDQSNWQGLCKPCHDGWKQRQEAQKFRHSG